MNGASEQTITLSRTHPHTHTHTPVANTLNNLWPVIHIYVNENHNACPREHFPLVPRSLSVFMAK